MDLKIENINPKLIRANPNQPRKYFDEEALNELAESIKDYGLIHPIRVKPIEPTENGKKYELVAGERRWRAYMIALPDQEIPAITGEVDSSKQQEMSLIENVHREDLTPVETANAIKKIFEANGIGYGAKKLAGKIGAIRKGYMSSTDCGIIKDICEHKIRMPLHKVEGYLPIVDLPEGVKDAEREKNEEERLTYKTLSRLATVENPSVQQAVYERIKPEKTEEGTIERVSHEEASKIISAVNTVKSEALRDELLDRESELRADDVKKIDTQLSTEEEKERAIEHIKSGSSPEFAVSISRADEKNRDVRAERSVDVGELDCPECGKKFSLIHIGEGRHSRHKLEEIFDESFEEEE